MATSNISEARIASMALSNIGHSGVESLTGTEAGAKECDLWYDFSRKQALAVNDWNFARRRLTLATHSDDPPAGVWAYRYQYPSDCIALRKIQNPAGEAADAISFEIELSDDQSTKSILTDLDDAVGIYTMNLTEVTLFSEFFVQLLSFALAAQVAYPLTGKQEVRTAMIETFRNMSLVAPAVNANEQVGSKPRDAEWIRER
jgi:hypothetical protein